jgi:hypothetical protein
MCTSGHIPAGVDAQDGITYNFHYWYVFVEAEVEDPMSVPLLVWSNGGPGAASSYGLFAEFGPLILSDQSFLTPDYNATGVPSLFYNPHAWTKAANILIVNGGGPVGYTYCDCSGARTDCSPSGNGTRCGNWVHNPAEPFFFLMWFFNGLCSGRLPHQSTQHAIRAELVVGVPRVRATAHVLGR